MSKVEEIGWVLTDESTNQYGRYLGDDKYEFKEDRLVDPLTGLTETYQSVIDLKEYSQAEIQKELDAFGYVYSETDDWIIAECIFELEN
jgi:hypothetical protein